MPWTCSIVSSMEEAKETGNMWLEPDGWYVRLPDGGVHNVHAKTGDGTGWQISGEAPNFTVTPSIRRYPNHEHKGWHGYITSGILSDDYDGRTYDAD